MNIARVKKWINPIRSTPFHPQWLLQTRDKNWIAGLLRNAEGPVLDIGCGNRYARQYLRDTEYYIGVDYFETATGLYHTVPDIYADAQTLPFADHTMGTVLLLDVLEHIPSPDDCLAEVRRVLRPNGKVILQIPFLYPLHDVPLDFHRWTGFGLARLLAQHKLSIQDLKEDGSSFETCALLTNLALSKIVLWCVKEKHPLLILAVLLPVLIPLINVAGYLAARLMPEIPYMPCRYRVVAARD